MMSGRHDAATRVRLPQNRSSLIIDVMPDPDTNPPSGPYFSTWGPLDGPILGCDDCSALDVVSYRSAGWLVGNAYSVGLVAHPQGPAKTFRLVLGKVELPGRWICVGREFVHLGEVAEEL